MQLLIQRPQLLNSHSHSTRYEMRRASAWLFRLGIGRARLDGSYYLTHVLEISDSLDVIDLSDLEDFRLYTNIFKSGFTGGSYE